MVPPRVNLYLVGFMGCGKSAVGRLVAGRLGFSFLDSDHAIEARAGLPITQIFAERGEPAFRQMEREFVEGGHPSEGCVVACGGGLVAQPGLLEALLNRGVVIRLMASAETIFQRTRSNRNRPLLNVDDPMAAIREMMERREPFYRAAGTQVLTDCRPMQEVAAHVCRVYRREAADSAGRNAGHGAAGR
jgi:shikimate kinase